MTDRSRRGQLVLIAAIALAIALVPLVLALTQLAFHEDVGAGTTTDWMGESERTLERALVDASGDTTEYEWHDRSSAATAVRENLSEVIHSIERSGLEAGTAISIEYNTTRTASWLSETCPGGPDRQFGDCEVSAGIAVQERSGETHVLGVAVDIAVTTPETESTLTTVLERS